MGRPRAHGLRSKGLTPRSTTGMFWEWVLLIAAVTAAAVGIDVGVRTGDPTAGFKAAMLTVANSFIPPPVNLGLGLVSGDTKTLVFQVVPFAGSVYAIVSAAENGMYATAAPARSDTIAKHGRYARQVGNRCVAKTGGTRTWYRG